MTAKIQCRICGSRDNLKLIWDGGQGLLDRLRICVNITVNYGDCLPEHICEHCENGLEFSYYFRKQGEETEKRLRLEMRGESIDSKKGIELAVKNDEINESDGEEFLEEAHAINTIVKQESMIQEVTLNEVANNNIVVKNESFETNGLVKTEEDMERMQDAANNQIIYNINDFDNLSEKNLEQLRENNTNAIRTTVEYDIDLLDMPANDINISQALPNEAATVRKSNSYNCPTCQENFSSQTDYRLHIKEHGNQRFNCIQCNKWFPTNYRLRQHAQTHLGDVETHKCELCPRVYRLRYNLTRHIRTVHDNQKIFNCSICSATFGRADILKAHLVAHSEEKHFQCPQCKVQFKTKRYLDSHLKIHMPKNVDTDIRSPSNENSNKACNESVENQKTYYCIHCGKESKHHYAHKNHLRTHSDDRPYQCEVCLKKFRTMAALITHERIHTDSRPYQCEICLLSFRQQIHLKEHRLIHDGVKDNICNICGVAFTKKGNLNAHMRVHTGERPYNCSLCCRSFTRQQLVKRHEKNVHGIFHEMEKSTDGKLPNSESENAIECDEYENDDEDELGEVAQQDDDIYNLTNNSDVMEMPAENIHVSSFINGEFDNENDEDSCVIIVEDNATDIVDAINDESNHHDGDDGDDSEIIEPPPDNISINKNEVEKTEAPVDFGECSKKTLAEMEAADTPSVDNSIIKIEYENINRKNIEEKKYESAFDTNPIVIDDDDSEIEDAFSESKEPNNLKFLKKETYDVGGDDDDDADMSDVMFLIDEEKNFSSVFVLKE